MKIFGLVIIVAISISLYYGYSNGFFDDFINTTNQTKQTIDKTNKNVDEATEIVNEIKDFLGKQNDENI